MMFSPKLVMGICFCLTDQQMGKSGSSSSNDIKEVEEVEGRTDAPLSWTAMCASSRSNQNLNHDQNQDECICKLNPNSFTHEGAVKLLNEIPELLTPQESNLYLAEVQYLLYTE